MIRRDGLVGLRAGLAAALTLTLMAVAPVAQAEEDDFVRGIVRVMHGIEVNISGGVGRDANDAIVLRDENPQLAGLTQRIIVGTSVEVIRVAGWRLTERRAPDKDGLEHLSVEMLGAPDKPHLSGPLEFYFDVTASGGRNLEWTVSKVPGWRPLPFDLAWAHYEKTNDYESQQRGMGYGLVYRLPAGVVSLFVYGVPGEVPADHAGARAEFDRAAAEITSTAQNREVRAIGQTLVEPDLYRQDYIIDGNWSSLGLTVLEGRYVKFRITGANDPANIGLTEAAIAELRQELAR